MTIPDAAIKASEIKRRIAVNAHLGPMAEAHRFLDDLERIAPGATVARISAGQPAKDPGRVSAILEGLRLAGLDEG